MTLGTESHFQHESSAQPIWPFPDRIEFSLDRVARSRVLFHKRCVMSRRHNGNCLFIPQESNESCHTVTHISYESCHAHECVISHTRMFERERFRLFHRRRRSDSVKFKQSRLSNFRQVYTGVPVHIKHVFLGVPKISNGFSKWVNGVPVTQKSVQENWIIWRSKCL